MPPGLDEDGQYQSDIIAVKCEPSRLSSPGIMSPELEPLVNHLLAQMNPSHHNPHQQLESPEPLEGDMNYNHNTVYATPQLSQPAQRTPRSRQKPLLTMEERLQLMPEKRPLPWRPGVEAGADNETGGDSRRKQIRFGCLLATRGEVQAVPCNSCTNGRGKFEICVALEGFFKGACASCQLSGRPNRCSIKEQDDVPVRSPAITSSNVPLPTPQDIPNTQPKIPTPTQAPNPKRRRKEKPKEKDQDDVPEWERERPQWEQELGQSQARQQMKDIVQRPWASINPPIPHLIPNGHTSTTDQPPLPWATVNQQPSPFGNGESNGSTYRASIDQGRREDTEEGGALIDGLPKGKQRQVYAVISGLQGGIEHLQRELDSLKRVLGIDD